MARLEEQDLDEKRLARRKRRQRSQLIAYITVVFLLIAIVALIVFGIRFLRIKFAPSHTSGEVETVNTTVTEEAENVVIETPEETAPVQEYTQEDILSEIVETCIAEMPLEDKVAGLFITTPEQLTGVETAVKAGTGTKEALGKYSVGGIVYAAKNIKSDEQIKEMLSTTASMSKYPVFTVMSDKSVNADAVKTTLGYEIPEEIQNSEKAKEVSSEIGSKLYQYGFNFVLAPEIELLEDGEMTSAYALGFKESGVTACAYRFPITQERSEVADEAETDKQDDEADKEESAAEGDSEENSDGGDSEQITKDSLVLREYEMIKPAIDEKTVGAVQMSNISLPGLTGDDTPASLSSKIVEDELRGTLGFEGIVISAPLNEEAVTGKYSSAEAAIAAVKAGCDMLYIPDNFQEAYEGLLSEVEDGSVSEERVNESLRRIFNVKYADKVNQISEGN